MLNRQWPFLIAKTTGLLLCKSNLSQCCKTKTTAMEWSSRSMLMSSLLNLGSNTWPSGLLWCSQSRLTISPTSSKICSIISSNSQIHLSSQTHCICRIKLNQLMLSIHWIHRSTKWSLQGTLVTLKTSLPRTIEVTTIWALEGLTPTLQKDSLW